MVLEARDWIALLPVFEERLRNIVGGVVNGVAFHAHHLGFDERRAFAAAGAFAGFVAGVVDLAGVGAVDDHTGNSVGDGTLGEVFHFELHVRGSGVGPQIVFDEQYESEILHGRKVQAFVGDAGGLAAVADVGHDGDVSSLQTGTEGDTSEDRDQIAKS